jgi:hypothetical protein
MIELVVEGEQAVIAGLGAGVGLFCASDGVDVKQLKCSYGQSLPSVGVDQVMQKADAALFFLVEGDAYLAVLEM